MHIEQMNTKKYKIFMFLMVILTACFQVEISSLLYVTQSSFHLAPKTFFRKIKDKLVFDINFTDIVVSMEILQNDMKSYPKSQIRNDELGVKWLSHGDMNIAPINTASDVRKISLNLINQAKEEILIEMNKFNDSRILDAVLNKAREGTSVKLIIGSARELLGKKELAYYDGIVAMSKKIPKLEVCFYKSSKETDKFKRRNVFPVDNHRKLIIVDGVYAHVGTCNIEAWYENKSAGLVLHSAEEVSKFRNFFYNTWRVQTGGSDAKNQRISNLKQLRSDKFTILHEKSVVGNVKFNIVDAFLKAERKIYIAQWGFTDNLLAELLIAKKRLNPEMDIKVVLNPTTVGFGSLASKVPYLKNLPTYLKLKKGGIEVRWGGDGTNSDAHDDYEHRKVIVCDDTVITGSADGWTRGLKVNAELSVSIDNAQLAEHFTKEIHDVWIKDLSKGKYSKPIEYVSTNMVHRAQEAQRNINSLNRKVKNFGLVLNSFLHNIGRLFSWDLVNFRLAIALRTESMLPGVNVLLGFFNEQGMPRFFESSVMFFQKGIKENLFKLAALIKYAVLKNRESLQLKGQGQNIYAKEVYISLSSSEIESAKTTGAVAPTVDWENSHFGVSLTENKYAACYENVKHSVWDQAHFVVAGKISKDANLLFFNEAERTKFHQWCGQFQITQDRTQLLPSYLKLNGYNGYALVNDNNIPHRYILIDETMFEPSRVIRTSAGVSLDSETVYVFDAENQKPTSAIIYSDKHTNSVLIAA